MNIAFGPQITTTGVTFRLWAPDAKHVDLLFDRPHEMQRDEHGWYAFAVADAGAGTRYSFLIDGETKVPDPASHFQPEDIDGKSEVIDHSAYRWKNDDWKGRPWEESVILECHVGTFTKAGTYRGMLDHLDQLAETGITAIELMPLNDFPGARNWGYDGVLWYAPDHSYGTPDDLKRLIDEAHARGIMVFLDVVYNHFGPHGNYLGRYASGFFCDAQTPWGAAIDYRDNTVRAFAIENALHWLDHYRFDGLRLDAVHAIVEPGHSALLSELSRAVGKLATMRDRHIHLILENDDNQSSLLDAGTRTPAGQFRAQWNDDYHHAWHVLLTGETQGYYHDYARKPLAQITRMLKQGFAYQGEPSEHRGGKRRGEPSGSLSPLSFVNFLQNHDQIGNRALGDRLEWSADQPRIELALQVLLLAPMVPMLFMGEEWGSRTRFPFFCDFAGDLADAVRNGRRKEFAEAYETYGNDVPDPLAEETFLSSILNWEERETTGAHRHALVKSLLEARSKEIVPHLTGCAFANAGFNTDDNVLGAAWTLGDGRRLILAANCSDRSRPAPSRSSRKSRTIWGDSGENRLPPLAVIWSVEDMG